MVYYAVTINRLEQVENLKTIDQVYYLLLTEYEGVNIISAERNQLNENIHYHALCYNELSASPKEHYSKIIDNELELEKYYNYVKKDGRFKVFKALQFDLSDKWYLQALECVKSDRYNHFDELISDNPHFIPKINTVSKLWEIFRYSLRK